MAENFDSKVEGIVNAAVDLRKKHSGLSLSEKCERLDAGFDAGHGGEDPLYVIMLAIAVLGTGTDIARYLHRRLPLETRKAVLGQYQEMDGFSPADTESMCRILLGDELLAA